MIEDQGDKLSKLADDITNEGLNPGDPIFITKHEKQTKQYNVLEGNRRVTALKLLENPDLIPETNQSPGRARPVPKRTACTGSLQ